MAQWLTNPTRNREVAVRSLPLLSGLRIRRGREPWCGSDPVLLWLWCGPAATAPIRRLAWEPPHATGVAPEKAKRQKDKKQKTNKKNPKTKSQNKTKQKNTNYVKVNKTTQHYTDTQVLGKTMNKGRK